MSRHQLVMNRQSGNAFLSHFRQQRFLGQSSGAMFAGSIQDRLRARDDKLSGYRGYPVNVSGHVEKVTLCHQQVLGFLWREMKDISRWHQDIIYIIKYARQKK